MNKRIAVIGSFNIDLVMTAGHFPVTGESVRCDSFDIFIGGGKGANQAAAIGRLGGDVMMAGKLGTEFYGPQYREVMIKHGVKCDCVEMVENERPGTAFIAVDGNSNNILFVYPGANNRVDCQYIDSIWTSLAECDIFLIQLEIPLETNIYLAQKISGAGKSLILDPAPAMDLPDEIYPMCDIITPNEIELAQISGIHIENENDIKTACEKLIDKGAETVIAKAGKNGAYLATKADFTHIPPAKVNAVDPTAAGDSFNAGLAYSLANGNALKESAVFACAVAAISTTKVGAQSAMPYLEEVQKMLDGQK